MYNQCQECDAILCTPDSYVEVHWKRNGSPLYRKVFCGLCDVKYRGSKLFKHRQKRLAQLKKKMTFMSRLIRKVSKII